MRRQMARASTLLAIALTVSALAGCVSAAPAPVATETATPTPTPTPTPDPTLDIGGTAGQNRPFFEFTLEGLLATTPEPSSQQIVNTLAAAGFDKAAMEVTADFTPLGARADSILFAVQIDGQCIVGSIGDAELKTELTDVLGTGRCLVGRTLSIDW